MLETRIIQREHFGASLGVTMSDLVVLEGDYHRYTKDERNDLIDRILETRYRHQKTWEECSDIYDMSRSTIQRWRRTDEWQFTEAKWRRIMREETRSDMTGVSQDAKEVLKELMHTARSEFVRFSSAKTLLDYTGIDQEIEERGLDQKDEILTFLKKVEQHTKDKDRLRDAGIDPDTIIDVEAKEGGLLPDEIVVQNTLMAKSLYKDDEDDES